jgi:phosphoglycolate phosphatase
VTRIPFDVVVFDFDGTLVQSADVKHVAFFEIFPEECAPAVSAVLKRDPEGSRNRVIPAMIAEATARGLPTASLQADKLVEAYARQVAAGVEGTPEVPGVREILKTVGQHASVYIASTTPQPELLRHLELRDWTKWVREAYGFPAKKPEVVISLLDRHDCVPQRLLVVGDGETDEQAARSNGCAFLKAVPGWPEKLMSEFPSL